MSPICPSRICKLVSVSEYQTNLCASSDEQQTRYLTFYNSILDMIPGFRATLDELSYDELKPYVTAVSFFIYAHIFMYLHPNVDYEQPD